MIKKPNEMDFSNKHFTVILSGAPGVGKTTFALSAPNPILLDLDKGIDRVRAEHRCISSEDETYEELLEDLTTEDYKAAESVVIDTGGSLVQLMKAWAKKQDPKAARDGRAMFGIIKQEFDRLTWQIRHDKKHCIIIFHTTEIQKGDIVTTRLSCEGSAKDIVWTPADMGGHIFMQGNRRMIGFTPTDEYFAKGCFGISGLMEIPELPQGAKNDALTKIFEKAKKNINDEMKNYSEKKSMYDEQMREGKELIESIKDAKAATEAVEKFGGMKFALTAREELSHMLMKKADALGLKYDKKKKCYE